MSKPDPAPVSRIAGVDLDAADAYTQRVFEAQTKRWGAPLFNQRLYAKRPSIFRAVRGMWAGIDSSGLIDDRLKALLNRRVAILNGCVF